MAIIKIQASQLLDNLEQMKRKNGKLQELASPLEKKFNRCLYIGGFVFLILLAVMYFTSSYPEQPEYIRIFEVITISISILICLYGYFAFGLKADEYRTKMYSSEELGRLEAGIIGEELALRHFQKLDDSFWIIHGLPIYLKENEDSEYPIAETDFLLLGNNGLFLPENKYINGHISGNSSNKHLYRLKEDKLINIFPESISNPVLQVNKTLNILIQFLAERNINNVWINPIVYFSHENATIDIKNSSNVKIFCSNKDDILNYIQSYQGNLDTFTKEKIVKAIEDYLKELNAHVSQNKMFE